MLAYLSGLEQPCLRAPFLARDRSWLPPQLRLQCRLLLVADCPKLIEAMIARRMQRSGILR